MVGRTDAGIDNPIEGHTEERMDGGPPLEGMHLKSNQRETRPNTMHDRRAWHTSERRCYRRIDGRTDKQTDRPSYRDAMAHLKSKS